jgi:DNA invertase Pin-like site-specific DNA recombinase
MTSKKVGYIRVSSFGQNADRQLEGIALHKKFIDHASGKDANRPALEALLNYVREDDVVVVHSMDRLARNLDDLRMVVHKLNAQNIQVHFIKESLQFTGEDAPMSKFLLSVMGAFAEFERSLIKERQKEGIAIAKQKGKYKGRTKSISSEILNKIEQEIKNGKPKSKIAREYNIARSTLYNYLTI